MVKEKTSVWAHHQETIQRTTDYFQAQPQVRALILGGSIAHGFAKETSDVDINIVVSDEEYRLRYANESDASNNLQFVTTELSTYEGGYIDGKYISEGFLSQVEQSGSEPARFAFADAKILFSRMDNLEAQLQRITRYPVEQKVERIKQFYAQFEAWHWFISEANKKQNAYLLTTAIQKQILFGGRLLLAHNEMLYPFHKWFLAVLEGAKNKPDNIVELMQSLSQSANYEQANAFYELVKGFREWEHDPFSWGNRFMKETELAWLNRSPAVEDI
jgi:predicted nucleotidyltransferase